MAGDDLTGAIPRKVSLGIFAVSVLVAALIGTGAGLATDPSSFMEHEHCQDLPDSTIVAFEAIYEAPNGDSIYFAGGSGIWYYEAGDGNPGDWFISDPSKVHEYSGGGYEADYESHGDSLYVTANKSRLVIYEGNRTAVESGSATALREGDFVGTCKGEVNV